MGTRHATWAFEVTYPLFARVALIATWALALLAAGRSIHLAATGTTLGSDAHAYWLAASEGLSYERLPGQVDAFLYSPAFAMLLRPLGLLPWPAFMALWLTLSVAVLLWLLRPVPTRWALAFILIAVPELIVGNILILIAAAVVVGMRHPALWAFPLLTKVTTGVGALWFPLRREWRALAIAVGTTAAIVAVLVAVDPTAWAEWLAFLAANADGSRDGTTGFVLRVLAAVGLVIWGARRDQRWVIALATALATPILNAMTMTLLAAVPRLLHDGAVLPSGARITPVGRAAQREPRASPQQ